MRLMLVALLASAVAPGARAEGGVGIGAGYALRLSDDGREHGGTVGLFAETPALGALSLRADVAASLFGASTQAPSLFAPVDGALVAQYRVDETDVAAFLGLGPCVRGTWDGGSFAGLQLGVAPSLRVRFPLLHGIAADATIAAPVLLFDTGTGVLAGPLAGLVVRATVGVSFDLGRLLDPPATPDVEGAPPGTEEPRALPEVEPPAGSAG